MAQLWEAQSVTALNHYHSCCGESCNGSMAQGGVWVSAQYSPWDNKLMVVGIIPRDDGVDLTRVGVNYRNHEEVLTRENWAGAFTYLITREVAAAKDFRHPKSPFTGVGCSHSAQRTKAHRHPRGQCRDMADSSYKGYLTHIAQAWPQTRL